ncbi:hypothetical protein [Streptomyces sp. CC228A]|uniref:hypothetical protein n=1 Tax=Streptomyces sp. CC228A TaxID=2898186 RepID=UPI001F3F9AAB|nr:hypothetical protein [Streptomyces sp. CC228A]
MATPTATETHPATSPPALPLSLPQPVTALVTDRPDDLAVVDAAARLAAPRRVPVLLVVALPDRPRPSAGVGEDTAPAGVHLARVLARLRRDGVGCIPVATRLLTGRAGGRGPGPPGRCWTWRPATTPLWWWPPAGDRTVWTRGA